MIQQGISNEEIDRYLEFIRRFRAMRQAPIDAPAYPVPTDELERYAMKRKRRDS